MSSLLTSSTILIFVGCFVLVVPLKIHGFIITIAGGIGSLGFALCGLSQLPPVKKIFSVERKHDIPRYEKNKRYLAIDCEMVGVGPNGIKSALARVSIVDWDLNVVLDTYVKVADKVTDYRTQVSGIKRKHLRSPDAMEFRKCRHLVTELCGNRVLVGHGLDNDFDALMMTHPEGCIRDTSTYRPFQGFHDGKWRRRKLRELVQENLEKEGFQQAEHCSIDDARATMQLFHLVHKEWEAQFIKDD